MSTPETPTESASETPVADTNGDTPRAESILTPNAPQSAASADATPWWKRLLGRS
ncbi:MAG: hypothetical protein QOG85_1669 [Gaiellaceae bacterium]|jgi:hypothetical protein|nr:hypothetical protein [Gaiellaceae bacterium]